MRLLILVMLVGEPAPTGLEKYRRLLKILDDINSTENN
jgi:hypothetical protein